MYILDRERARVVLASIIVARGLIADLSIRKVTMEKFTKDEGRAWWVLVACFLGEGLITDGIGYSFGLLYTELLRVYLESYETTAWIESLHLAFGSIFALPLSFLIEKQGCRRATVAASLLCAASFIISSIANNIYIFYVTLGFCLGIGMKGVDISTEIALLHAFEKKRLLASGIATSGTGVGLLVMGPITGFLLSSYGLHGTFLIFSGICLNGVIFGLFIPSNIQSQSYSKQEMTENKADYKTFCEENNSANNVNSENRYLGLLRNLRYILWAIGGIIYFASLKTVIVFFPNRAQSDFGATTDEAAILVAVLGGTHIVARPMLGFLNTFGVTIFTKQIIYTLATLLCGIIAITSTQFNTMALQVFFVVSFGVTSAICVMYKYPILCDIIEMDDLEKAFGIYHTVEGFMYLAIIPMSGYLKDTTGSYSMTFLMLGLLQIFSAGLFLILPFSGKIAKSKI